MGFPAHHSKLSSPVDSGRSVAGSSSFVFNVHASLIDIVPFCVQFYGRPKNLGRFIIWFRMGWSVGAQRHVIRWNNQSEPLEYYLLPKLPSTGAKGGRGEVSFARFSHFFTFLRHICTVPGRNRSTWAPKNAWNNFIITQIPTPIDNTFHWEKFRFAWRSVCVCSPSSFVVRRKKYALRGKQFEYSLSGRDNLAPPRNSPLLIQLPFARTFWRMVPLSRCCYTAKRKLFALCQITHSLNMRCSAQNCTSKYFTQFEASNINTLVWGKLTNERISHTHTFTYPVPSRPRECHREKIRFRMPTVDGARRPRNFFRIFANTFTARHGQHRRRDRWRGG